MFLPPIAFVSENVTEHPNFFGHFSVEWEGSPIFMWICVLEMATLFTKYIHFTTISNGGN
jgi:hypothetical protein